MGRLLGLAREPGQGRTWDRGQTASSQFALGRLQVNVRWGGLAGLAQHMARAGLSMHREAQLASQST